MDAGELSIAKVLQKLENNKSLAVISPDYAAVFERFCGLFTISEAAGGVVENRAGDVLMIYKGRWDLPKGHREAGESWEACAVREVEEECGITGVECGDQVACTWHTYLLDGRWMLKQCRWYSMRYNGQGQPSPQADEGIEAVRWVAREDLAAMAAQSYRTIENILKTYIL